MTNSNGQTLTSRECLCGKICKNEKGLKIHQSRMKCKEQLHASQCTGLVPGETEKAPSPEAPHRAQSLQVVRTVPSTRQSEKRRIRWPQSSRTAEWQKFDKDADKVLEATAKGDVERRLQTMTTIIVSMAAERFGVEEERRPKQPYTKNQRAVKIHNIRKELKALKKQHKEASEEERGPLAELRHMLRKRLLVLRRAEQHRRRRRERARKRAAFINNPFGFIKELLGQRRSEHLACSKEKVDQHLHGTFSDPSRHQELGQCKVVILPPEPAEAFDLREPLLKEVQEVVRKARSRSAPGPSGTPYKVYKHCPKLLHRLWKILKGVWIPKEEDSKNISQFRIISLLSVEGKIFFSIIAKRLALFLLKNGYIDTSVQKGGIPGVPGCLEHRGVVTQLLREARENKGDLVVLWLDLANAYGSMPHKLVLEALERHHVPAAVRDLILDYYSDFSLRVSAGSTTSEWHSLEVRIITGCTISVILFALAMNMLLKSAETECRGPKTKSGIRQQPIRAFMDDLTVTTESVPGGRWILTGLEKLMGWARMNIPTISELGEVPIKSLGKFFDSSLRDTASIKSTCDELEGWLKDVDKSGLPGKFKAWIYQHGILPRVLWPLLLYEFPITTITDLERRVSCYLRRWLGLPRNPKVSGAGVAVKTGRKWRAEAAVEQAESRLRHGVLVGTVARGRAGLGTTAPPRFDRGKERRQLVQNEVRAAVEEERSIRAVGMRHQGAWTRWEQAVERKITWTDLWRAEPHCIKFLKKVTLEHILSCCPKALGEGRYRWRHDQVLKTIAESICSTITICRKARPMKHNINFIRAGEKPRTTPRATTGLLNTAQDWQLLVDLGSQLKFPQHIAKTTLRPDIVLVSEATKSIIMLELTVPWEERMEEAFERKREKYDSLESNCHSQGWKARCLPVEVGCRGFAGQSLCRAYTALGITGERRRRAIYNSTEAAEKASRWLWIKRADPWLSAARAQAEA
ncbi:Retrovirus-related Pol polyprotein from type-2 retrotransposable element R2DM [Merluccius polli]|uniref:Retrovirus-related Pol polyprotein from type-2 retrotransposable element R2DM n=1 Tax=Merluccius polli TaxID=89951 RepID=A0AA47NQN0_MERPO|nr:Retrovirus-related Pol polyprotein from type-2 retrotransposable element R2DM [Merluccius polli]